MTATTYGRSANYDWLSGNSRLINLSGQLLGAHIAHAGLIMFWAGSITLLELSNLNPNVAISEQGLLLIPNLARLGWGVGANGLVTDTYPYLVIAILHLVSSAILGAGGLFHVFKGVANLKDSQGRAVKFHYEWGDPQKMGFILGHHLIFLGVAALLFVGKATLWGGVYDSVVGNVRVISDPTINPVAIFDYLFGFSDGVWNPLGMAAVDSLEDIIGGHIWVGAACIAGGAWHIVVPPMDWAKKALTYNGHAILSYSLAGVALMAFTSAYFVAFNDLAFPSEFYGVDRSLFAGVQSLLCVTFLGGHIWHGLKGRAEANDSGAISEGDRAQATVAGFVTLAIVVISLVLLSGIG